MVCVIIITKKYTLGAYSLVFDMDHGSFSGKKSNIRLAGGGQLRESIPNCNRPSK
jgi:hypothetical protein